MITSGSHLGVVRNWIKCHFCFGNGETVIWGSHECLKGRDVHVDDLERLSQDIRDAILKEYKVKPKEHKYKFVIIADNTFFQDVDTSYEAWCALYKIEGHVSIYFRGVNNEGQPSGLGAKIIDGTPEEIRSWLLENSLEEMV